MQGYGGICASPRGARKQKGGEESRVKVQDRRWASQHDGWSSHVCSTSSSLSWWRRHPVAYATGRRRTPFPLKMATVEPVAPATGRRQFPDFPYKYPLRIKCRDYDVFRRILLFRLSQKALLRFSILGFGLI
uniref:Uncharacterized protein n=1 Tax=Opuntia streptacantha TaxID=393608 RepID=A0A7C8ZH52_OPUST